MKTDNTLEGEEIVFKKKGEHGGAYLDREFLKAYWDVVKSLHELIPDDRSRGNLSLGGVASMCMARCKAVVERAKTMENIMKAITAGRK